MLNFSYFKIAIIFIVCAFALAFSLPNFISDESPLRKVLPDEKVNLGLDLQGGSYLLLEVDFKSYFKEQLDNLRNEVRDQFRTNKVNEQRIGYTGGINFSGDKIEVTLTDSSMVKGVEKLLHDMSRDLDVVAENNTIRIGYNELYIKKMQQNLVEQSIEIIRRRVDETGTREPDIQRQGENRILLQVPGLKDPEHLKGLLGRTAKMTFHLLDETLPYPDTTNRPTPPGTVRLKSDNSAESYAIRKKVELSGDLLIDASTGFDRMGQPVVNIRFNNLGAKKFGEITKANLGKPFAIVLDNKVLTAPVIRGVILGGSAEISGRFTTKEANDLSLLLRAGALPAPLNIVEERTVGPSLGSDSIEAGKKAVLLGTGFVLIVMLIVYGRFGVYANIALFVNIALIFAVMSVIGATLTLPGIAGIVLTIGMAVDANVLIFERIHEEVQIGKTPFAAIEQGFDQAFRTIADSNITTLIAALLLYNLGSGPVKGFAVTLSVGIVASMFSAILLTRFMIVLWLKKKRPNKLAI